MKTQLFANANGLFLAASVVMAQSGDIQVNSFQSVKTMGGSITFNPVVDRIGAVVTGSPMSAKEVNKTVQTLSDGTELENTHSTLFYRDSQGRTRTEPQEPNAAIVIQDPVAGVRIILNPSNKTATRMQMATSSLRVGTPMATTAAGSADSVLVQAKLDAETAAVQDKLKAEAAAAGGNVVSARSSVNRKANSEDLGFEMKNGVMAQGTRSTVTIPQGQIGNNREIHVVNERWFSKDLQMVVKSINTDPRFGVTTLELTNLSQNAPDPTLFQVPTGYTIIEGGRGARGGVGR